MNIYGMQIIESDMALERTNEPVRVHKVKKWHLDQIIKRKGRGILYHDRIQKKWIKRWGYIMKPAIYQTPNAIICHPSLTLQIKAALNQPKVSMLEQHQRAMLGYI